MQNSQEITCARVSLLNKVARLRPAFELSKGLYKENTYFVTGIVSISTWEYQVLNIVKNSPKKIFFCDWHIKCQCLGEPSINTQKLKVILPILICSMFTCSDFRSNHPEEFLRKGVLKISRNLQEITHAEVRTYFQKTFA